MNRKIMATLLATLALLEAEAFLPTSLEPKSVLSTVIIFEIGNFKAATFDLGTSNGASPPKSLLIVSPIKKGTYPVILFHHGTSLHNSWYTDLLTHISSHGCIVVAPQLYKLLPPSALDELDSAAKLANWLPSGLKRVLPENVEGDLDKIALAGHSRGGYIAFALALGLSNTLLEVNLSALIGVDPVAGQSKSIQLKPRILTNVPCSFNLSIPVTVIGTGLGDKTLFFPLPASAPDGVNHKEFLNECKSPCGHFDATEYGHMDMLNDNIGLIGNMARSVCKGCQGQVSRVPMRRTLGGIIVAFLKTYFDGESEDYMTILQNPSVAPIKLDPVQFKEAENLAQV